MIAALPPAHQIVRHQCLASDLLDRISRMVRRLTQKVDLRPESVATLQCAIACASREILVNDMAASIAWRRPALGQASVDAARSHLDAHAPALLEDTFGSTDYRPLPDEL